MQNSVARTDSVMASFYKWQTEFRVIGIREAYGLCGLGGRESKTEETVGRSPMNIEVLKTVFGARQARRRIFS